MQLDMLDHVNIRTANLEEMVDWYTDILGMTSGKRPSFQFPGAWMYMGDNAPVHLIGVTETPTHETLQIEHFAFSATGLPGFLEKLEQSGVDYELGRVPEFEILQVNIFDYDGNHIHIDFVGPETDGLPV
ncbi:VOC family protein [Sneathiella marina]|uniref:VOC family protein n=1 Tax=Sneathiella marina TaxID=2950108 RepID=A0ABY4W035_9PROT|nr:VOC family protein [Sneathiella marina]USG60546.1 VOC family protein [Sneathiella marina]